MGTARPLPPQKIMRHWLEPISNSKIAMQRANMCYEQGASGLAGLEALVSRWNAAGATVALQTSFICELR